MNRDEADDATTGQQVRRTIHAADFFVNNHDSPSSETDPVADALSRFLQIVSGTAVVWPTRDERGMYAAWGAGLRSSCLSRQVGVAILDAKGDLIATGTNDVPRAGVASPRTGIQSIGAASTIPSPIWAKTQATAEATSRRNRFSERSWDL